MARQSAAYFRCVAEIKSGAGKDLSEDELTKLADEVYGRAEQLRRERSGMSQDEAVRKALAEGKEETIRKGMLQKRSQYLMTSAFSKLMNNIESVWKDDPKFGIEATLIGSSVYREGSQRSINGDQHALANKFINGFAADLQKSGLFDLWKSGALDEDAYKALGEMYKDNPNYANIRREGRELAEIIFKYQEVRRTGLNNAGAYIGKLPDFITHQNHDMYRVRRAKYEVNQGSKSWYERNVTDAFDSYGDFYEKDDRKNFEAWRDFVLPKLDHERTFKGLFEGASKGQFQNAKDNYLWNIWRNLASGDHMRNDQAQTGFSMPKSLAKEISEPRILHFKDAESRFAYDEKFGRGGSLIERVALQMRRAGHEIAIMQRMGPNPELTYSRMKQAVKLMREDSVQGRLASDWKEAESKLDAYWDEISGKAHIPGASPTAAMLRSLRAIHVMSKLGAVVFSKLSELGMVVSELSYQGVKPLEGWGSSLEMLVTGYGRGDVRAERLRWASELGVGVDSLRGAHFSNFSSLDGAPGWIARSTHFFNRINGLQWFTDTNRMAFAAMMSHRFALQADLKFDALSVPTRRMLQLYGVKPYEWELMRTKGLDTAEDRSMLNPSNASKLTDVEISAMLEQEGFKPTDRRIRERREDIESKFRTMFSTRADNAILTTSPRAATFARTGGFKGIEPGTTASELMKSLFQFKTFPASVLDRIFGRELYGYSDRLPDPSNGLVRSVGSLAKDFSKLNSQGLMGIASYISYATFLGFVALWLKTFFRGETQNAPETPQQAATLLAESLVQGCGLGLYGDFIAGQREDRYGHRQVMSLLGPTAGDIQDLNDSWPTLLGSIQLMTGINPKTGLEDPYAQMKKGDQNAAQFFRTVHNHLPGQNLFYVRMAFDYLLFYRLQEEFHPGSLAAMEKRGKEERGITYRLPPSQHFKFENLTADDLGKLFNPLPK